MRRRFISIVGTNDGLAFLLAVPIFPCVWILFSYAVLTCSQIRWDLWDRGWLTPKEFMSPEDYDFYLKDIRQSESGGD